MERREFIKLMGGGVIYAAMPPLAGCADTQNAARPWQMAGNYATPIENVLSYALLAPNPHNQQPWLVDLKSDNQCVLYPDLNRMLPETDPFNRQITIGFGCFLGLAEIAAAHYGYQLDIQPFPKGANEKKLDQRPIANLQLIKKAQVKKDPLFQEIGKRRSNKQVYDTRAVSDETLAILVAAGDGSVHIDSTNDKALLAELRQMTWEGHQIEQKTPMKRRESIDLMRLGSDESNANPDGIDLHGGMISVMIATGLVSRETLDDPNSFAFQSGMDLYRDITHSAMAYIWVTTKNNRRLDQLQAGRNWVRINLAATAMSLNIHPLSQVLQEYEEMTASYNKIHRLLRAENDTIQMLGRLGYGKSEIPSPRWPLEKKRFAA